MDIFFTFDYELFFGNKSGSAEKCLLEPTNELIRIAEKSKVSFTFFIDTGYLVKLNEFRKKFPALEKNYSEVSRQLETLVRSGHDLQLHIHPHWENNIYNGSAWVMNTNRYKLADFSDSEAAQIFESCYEELKKHCPPPVAFRAGGWCIQPFEKFKSSFIKSGIVYDSSVYKGGSRVSVQYDFDFSSAPSKTSWRFEDDPLKENPSGPFQEIAMTAQMLSPIFFWKLFLLGRMNPGRHKPVGDGFPLAVPGYRKQILTQFTLHCTSADGYFASEIETASRNTAQQNSGNEFVVIGHPKAMTKYSIEKLEVLIPKLQKNNSITSFTLYHAAKRKK
ncbi:MAG TPA: hypothetical protein VI757_11330 [Bacteroidia bacterium]|nr:hypothetical protein [Bacteroidia bacterium]